jgi:hypothetical protein
MLAEAFPRAPVIAVIWDNDSIHHARAVAAYLDEHHRRKTGRAASARSARSSVPAHRIRLAGSGDSIQAKIDPQSGDRYVGATLTELYVLGQGYATTSSGRSGIIRPAAACLKPLPEGSASTQECRLRSTSWAGRQAGHEPGALCAYWLHADARVIGSHTG